MDEKYNPWFLLLEGLSHVFRVLDGTYRQKLRSYHHDAIVAVLAILPPDVGNKIKQQLQQKHYVSYMSHGRINRIFFKKMPDHMAISDPAFVDRLYKVEMFVDGKKQTAHVIFYEGRIFVIEFRKPSKFYIGKDIRFGAVTLGAPTQSFTGAIDRQEHGKDGHFATGE